VQGVDVFDIVLILISCITKVLDPPPSLRDTSASGGHEMAIFAIATQSRKGGESYIQKQEIICMTMMI
jgi:hypothetical protein